MASLITKIKIGLLTVFLLVGLAWMVSGSLRMTAGREFGDRAVQPLGMDLVADSRRPDSAHPKFEPKENVCAACHEDVVKKFATTVHGKTQDQKETDGSASCSSCHGDGVAHMEGGDISKIKNPKKLSADEINQTCSTCHSQIGDHAIWRGSKHESAGLSCLSCHSAHHPGGGQPRVVSGFANMNTETKLLRMRSEKETCYQCHSDVRKSENQRSTHLFRNEDRESRISCSACHDSHGSTGEMLMKSTSINDTCYTCHAEKRGPFLWEHAPARENCASCHKPHGSNHISLLKARTPMLCQSCHIQGRHQTVAGKPNSAFMLNRSCSNCHSQIHGSNHPSGFNLQR